MVSKELREERAAELAEEMGDWIRFGALGLEFQGLGFGVLSSKV